MPKLKGETNEQWMERIRAARFYTNNQNDPKLDFVAFMALFHPEYSDEKVRDMSRNLRK